MDINRSQYAAPLRALHQQVIDVPDSPGGRSDTACDVGVVNVVARLNAGDMAPEFAVKTLDDKMLKLSDFKGKYVLLHFWATWNASSLEDTPDLKETYEAYKNNPQFAMIGLNLDTNVAAARAYASQNQLVWPQGGLGQWSESVVPDDYGIEDLPFILVIDKSGRVLVTGLRGGTIKSTVDAALNP
jgi:thiol-disulfide isomerase/thioredoxin